MASERQIDELSRSEARYRTLFERMPVAFWELDPRGVREVYDALRAEGIASFADHVAAHPDLAARLRDMLIVTDVNAETVRMMGATSRDQLLGPMGGTFLDQESFIRAAELRFQGANTITDVARVNTLDGRVIDVLWTIMFSDEDRPDLNLIGAIDITERNRAVEEVSRSEAKFRILFEHMPLPLVQTNSGALLSLFRDLRAQGVEDLGAYIDAHAGFLEHLFENITIDEVNQPMAELLGAADKSEITGSIARYWKTNPDTVRRSLEARYRGDKALVEETQVDALDGRLVDILYSVAYPDELNPLGIGLAAFIDNTERKRATEEIQRSEVKFRNLFNQTPIALWQLDSREAQEMLDAFYASDITDYDAFAAANRDFLPALRKKMRIREINQAALALIGAREEDRSSQVIFDHLFDSMEALHAAAARRRGDSSFSTESKIRTLDGRVLDVLSSVAFADPDDPEGLHLVAAIDISDRKRADEELRRSEIKFRNLFNQTPIALWQFDSRAARPELNAAIAAGITDVDAWLADHPDFFPAICEKLEVTEINDAALELFGAPDWETLKPRMISLWLRGRDLLGAAAARVGGATSYSVEIQVRKMDGMPVDILANIFFGDLNLVGAIDISDRKRADEELRRSEMKFRNLFNQTPIALWQFNAQATRPEVAAAIKSAAPDIDAWLAANPDFFPSVLEKIEVTEINEAALALFGATDREQLRPKIMFNSLHARDLLLASIERAKGERSYGVETQIHTLEGRPIDILAKVFFPDPGDPDGKNLVGAIDISDRKRAEEMLRQVQAEFAHAARVATLGELTASIAHEVNQPLAAIVTNGEASLRWLSRENPDIEEVRTLAARMVADARRAADVIARIRTMATGRAPEHKPMCVNEAAEDAMSFLKHEFELHRITAKLELTPRLPMVAADWTQLQQVFVNLAVNAMQAMLHRHCPRPTVTVRTSRAPDGGILVEIDDNGPGFPPDQVGHLFDSFFTTKEGGLGIGLSICRSIIEAHGGRISAANLPVGARFSFTLPTAGEPEARISAPRPGPGSRGS